jgi:hypothetical protein
MVQVKHFFQIWSSEIPAALFTYWTVFQNNRTFCFFFLSQTLLFPSDKRALQGSEFCSPINYHDPKQRFSNASWRDSPSRPWSHHCWGFTTTFRHITGSSGRVFGLSQRPLPNSTNTHKRRASMLPAGFEPATPVSKRPYTQADFCCKLNP